MSTKGHWDLLLHVPFCLHIVILWILTPWQQNLWIFCICMRLDFKVHCARYKSSLASMLHSVKLIVILWWHEMQTVRILVPEYCATQFLTMPTSWKTFRFEEERDESPPTSQSQSLDWVHASTKRVSWSESSSVQWLTTRCHRITLLKWMRTHWLLAQQSSAFSSIAYPHPGSYHNWTALIAVV